MARGKNSGGTDGRERGRPARTADTRRPEPDDEDFGDEQPEDGAPAVVHGADLMLAVRVLGYGGLVPFFAAAAAAWVQPAARLPIVGQIAYAATILSFLGAVHWGIALAKQDRPRPERPGIGWITWGIVPATIAWLALLGPEPWNLALMAGAFVLALAMDLFGFRMGNLPRWYVVLRIHLTAGAVLACAATVAAYLLRHAPD